MQRNPLGTTDLTVSEICMGTMTFGRQNSADEAFTQLDLAVERGVNFIDTAEIYPVPTTLETYGMTEEIVGSWLKAKANRDRVIVATKAAGPGTWVNWVRDGRSNHDRANLNAAVDGSLRRLQTDYIDLYQLHWPARPTNFFGQLGYKPAQKEPPVNLSESLLALKDLVTAGKIRAFGVSNETPWGLMTFNEIAKANEAPTVASIQNPYNFLNRSFEVGLAEIALRDQVSLLAYSPLAFGVLSGKYLKPRSAPGRLDQFSQYNRYSSDLATEATKEYVALAEENDLDPSAMAIAFVRSRPFCTSAIVGATTTEQLETCLDAASLSLSKDLLKKIDAIHRRYPIPCP